MRTHSLARLSVLALAILASGCGSDSSVAPGNTHATTLSQVLSEMTLPSLANATALGSGVPVQAVGPLVASACSYAAASQSFVCPTASAGGLTIAQSYTLLDASGKSQTQFDASTTAAVRVTSSITGAVSESGVTTTFDEQQTMTLSGLLTGTHVMNGSATMHLNGTVVSGGVTVPITSTMTMLTSNLVLPASGSSTAWPLSGTITEDMTSSSGTSSPSIATHMVMTFNGTSKVTAVMTIAGTVEHCTIDLSLGAATCA